MHLNVDLDTEIEKRDDFDATTERETISAQNIDFFDVAVDAVSDCFDVEKNVAEKVSTSEFFEIISEEIIDDVSINADSLNDENVTKNVNIAIIAFVDSIDTANDCFDVTKNVIIAIIANIDVIFADSLDADFDDFFELTR